MTIFKPFVSSALILAKCVFVVMFKIVFNSLILFKAALHCDKFTKQSTLKCTIKTDRIRRKMTMKVV